VAIYHRNAPLGAPLLGPAAFVQPCEGTAWLPPPSKRIMALVSRFAPES
jgi:hypothetical protein